MSKLICCSHHSKEHEHYSIQGSRLPFHEGKTKWSLMNFSTDLPKHEQIMVFKDVFSELQSHMAFLKFQSSEDPDPSDEDTIKVYFTNKYNKYVVNGVAWDSPFIFKNNPSTIAVGYFPDSQYRGHIFVDDTKFFTLKHESQGFRLRQIIKHELGHILGLRHTDAPNDLMNPIYSPDSDFTEDTLMGLATLYKQERIKSLQTLDAKILIETTMVTKKPKKLNWFTKLFGL